MTAGRAPGKGSAGTRQLEPPLWRVERQFKGCATVQLGGSIQNVRSRGSLAALLCLPFSRDRPSPTASSRAELVRPLKLRGTRQICEDWRTSFDFVNKLHRFFASIALLSSLPVTSVPLTG